ncbi:MAG: class II glutamine amidotransferase [Actinomycetota bacterium]|nr:class II glutamine amidotransferase [Actinomycetota bacterium]
MCRWLAYSGEPLQPSTLILDSPHSLVAQSRDSRMGAETVNGDGFGFGWYPGDGSAMQGPGLFRSIEPAWNDQNLREITEAVQTPLFFSHVRAASGPPIQQTNCHPFRYERWLFMHNGDIGDFGRLKRDLTIAVDPSLYADVSGTTDSEVLFHLALSSGLQDDPVAGMATAIRQVESVGEAHGVDEPFQGTVAVTDGATIWAFRYSSRHRSRTLFHSAEISVLEEMYPDDKVLRTFGRHAHVVVSEPLSDLPGAFVEVPESTVVVLDRSGYHRHPFLAEPT